MDERPAAGPDRNGDADAPKPRFGMPGEQVPAAARKTLAQAPGERYAIPRAGADDADVDSRGATRRAAVAAVLVAALGAVVIVVLASPLAFSEPLVIVALATGIGTGFVTRRRSTDATTVGRRRAIAIGAVALGIVVANLVVWQLALAQGGVLPFADYVLTVFGPVAPLELVAATLAAWATA
jgi:hypothetical protein